MGVVGFYPFDMPLEVSAPLFLIVVVWALINYGVFNKLCMGCTRRALFFHKTCKKCGGQLEEYYGQQIMMGDIGKEDDERIDPEDPV